MVRNLWIGLGWHGTVTTTELWAGIQQVVVTWGLAEGSIAGVATIDRKSQVAALQTLCQMKAWSLQCFSAEALQQVTVPSPAAAVAKWVGTASVAEAAAVLAASKEGLETIGVPELQRATLIVPKQIIPVRDRSHPRASLTIAIAQSPKNDRDKMVL
jgi:cobalt-precorrin 5A hydrolase / precorrin-3B C17-methyltransferase